ncbi:MAG: histidinol-phosphatase [Chloroflexi bacterium]|nr:histidinol-phosphatase [Chloroflexota bacterium]
MNSELWTLNLEPTFDYHVHSDHSIDAAGSIDDFCRRAVEMGLREICFTPHYDAHPARPWENWVVVGGQRVHVGGDWVGRYHEDVLRAREAFPQLGVRFGVEIDYHPDLEEALARFVDRHPFDFVLGSVHCVDLVALTNPDEARAYFARHTARQVCERYYWTAERAVRSGLFDAIGHLDVYRRYGAEAYGAALLQAHVGLVEPVLALMADRGVGIEVSAAPFRGGDPEPHPQTAILELARQAGIAVVTTSTDAHEPAALGVGIDRVRTCLRRAGFTSVYTFERRRPIAHPL